MNIPVVRVAAALALSASLLAAAPAIVLAQASTVSNAADPTFGTNGIATTNISTNSVDSAEAVAVQSDGKIVVAGLADGVPAVLRYNANGSLDTTFDTDGIVRAPLWTLPKPWRCSPTARS